MPVPRWCRSFCGVPASSWALGLSPLAPPGWVILSGALKPAHIPLFLPQRAKAEAVLSGQASLALQRLAKGRTQSHLALRARPLRLIDLILLFLCCSPVGCMAEVGPHGKPECTKENPALWESPIGFGTAETCAFMWVFGAGRKSPRF